MTTPFLKRLLWPQSLAVVGASGQLATSNNAVLPMLEAVNRPWSHIGSWVESLDLDPLVVTEEMGSSLSTSS